LSERSKLNVIFLDSAGVRLAVHQNFSGKYCQNFFTFWH